MNLMKLPPHNLSLDLTIVPAVLNVEKITSVFKEAGPPVFNTNRPISVSKKFFKLVYTSLIQHLDKNVILYAHQYDFKKTIFYLHGTCPFLTEIYKAKIEKKTLCAYSWIFQKDSIFKKFTLW